MVTYQEERWSTFLPEVRPLWQQHWEEIAIHKDVIKLSVDEVKYAAMDAAGILKILTIRDDGKLVGYYKAFLLPHPHYCEAGLMGFTDIYWIKPEYRSGGTGIQLFIEAEKMLKNAGATKAYISCKIKYDVGPIFNRLGWVYSDKMFVKVL